MSDGFTAEPLAYEEKMRVVR